MTLCFVDGASGLGDWLTSFGEGMRSKCVGMASLSLHETRVDLTRFVEHRLGTEFSSFSSCMINFRFVEANDVDFDSEVKSNYRWSVFVVPNS